MANETKTPSITSPEEQRIKAATEAVYSRCKDIIDTEKLDDVELATPGSQKHDKVRFNGVRKITNPQNGEEGFMVAPHHTGRPISGWYEVFPDSPAVWVAKPKDSGKRLRPDEFPRIPLRDVDLSKESVAGVDEYLGLFENVAGQLERGQIFDGYTEVAIGGQIYPRNSIRSVGARAIEKFREL